MLWTLFYITSQWKLILVWLTFIDQKEANKNQFLYHIHEFHAYGWRNLPKYAVYFYSKHLTYLPGTYSCHANSRMHFPCITIPCLIEDKNQLQSANWILGISPNMTTLDKLGVNKCMIQNIYAYTCEKSSGIDDYAYSPGNLTCNIEIWDLPFKLLSIWVTTW